ASRQGRQGRPLWRCDRGNREGSVVEGHYGSAWCQAGVTGSVADCQTAFRRPHHPDRERELNGNRWPAFAKLERAMGIEPTTYSLGSCRSTTELRPRAAQNSERSVRGARLAG